MPISPSVGTTGEEFLVGASAETRVKSFPAPDEEARFVWNQSTQHLELVEGSKPKNSKIAQKVPEGALFDVMDYSDGGPDIASIEWLIAHGANVNATAYWGSNIRPLHVVANAHMNLAGTIIAHPPGKPKANMMPQDPVPLRTGSCLYSDRPPREPLFVRRGENSVRSRSVGRSRRAAALAGFWRSLPSIIRFR